MKTLLIAFICFISGGIHPFGINVFSQNITNTLGTGGLFTIKDASNNYLTLNQSTGQLNLLRTLRLENTTSPSLGTIFKGPDRFLHNYGTNNTFLGINSGNFTMSGFNNTALGFSSLYSNIDGDFNTAVGVYCLSSNTEGFNNTALGSNSLYLNTTGFQNTAVGLNSLISNTEGYDNTALGVNSLSSNITGFDNTAVGVYSLSSNTEGFGNTAVGFESLANNYAGIQNTSVGMNSLLNNNTGYNNTALGYQSLYTNTTGSYNTALGNVSLFSNTGNFNTALGHNAGSTITNGHNLTCIGVDAAPTTPTALNEITLGNIYVSSLRCNVTSITSLSDARDKKNITDLSLGLDFIMKIKPRLFNWDKREWYDSNISNGSKMKEAPTAGFIAQELDEVQTSENAEWLNLVLKDNPEKLEATSGNLLPVMVKAIQELKVEGEKLKVENEKLKVESEKLIAKSVKLEVENIELKNADNDMNARLLLLEQTQNKLLNELEKFKSKESKMTEVNEGEEK